MSTSIYIGVVHKHKLLYYKKTENFTELANLTIHKDILLYYYTRINKEISD